MVIVDELSRTKLVDKIDQLSVDELSVDEMSVDEMFVDEFSYHRKKSFEFFKNNFKRINHFKFIQHKS